MSCCYSLVSAISGTQYRGLFLALVHHFHHENSVFDADGSPYSSCTTTLLCACDDYAHHHQCVAVLHTMLRRRCNIAHSVNTSGGSRGFARCSGWTGRLGTVAGAGDKPIVPNMRNARAMRSIASNTVCATATRKAAMEGSTGGASMAANPAGKHAAATVSNTGTSATTINRSFSYLRVGSRGRWDGGDGKTALYVLMGLNVFGTGLWVYNGTTGGRYTALLEKNLCVPLREKGFRLHTLLTANFSSRNVIDGALATVVLYFVGSTAAAAVGPQFLLAAFVGGGAFAQLCQAVGPEISFRTGLPSVFYMGLAEPTCGAWAGIEPILAWYILTFPFSQVNLYMLIPVPTWVFGAAWCGGIFLTAASNGQLQVPFISSNPRTLWRDMGGVTAGAVLWLLAARRPHLFRKRFF